VVDRETHWYTFCVQGPTYCIFVFDGTGRKTDYWVWNPFRGKLAAAILGGVGNIQIKPGAKLLYLGAASGTTVSHVASGIG